MIIIFVFKTLYLLKDIDVLTKDLVDIFYTPNFDENRHTRIIVYIIWCTIDTAFVLLIIFAYSRIEKESIKIGPLLIRQTGRMPAHSLIRENVTYFALEVASRKFKLTASGLFPINFEIIFLIAGFCATNFAVLTQAHIMALQKQPENCS
ncbi:Hypothetical predicted protein [Cloeon dipterum]|uniref:Uncharacterized protein n=1 Tax=Cloeon dipterum TaxID=197152 RepID=A0A8S1CM54_9INSE|nr:Hypothetical predicted protein [Cloeon dipterum]